MTTTITTDNAPGSRRAASCHSMSSGNSARLERRRRKRPTRSSRVCNPKAGITTSARSTRVTQRDHRSRALRRCRRDRRDARQRVEQGCRQRRHPHVGRGGCASSREAGAALARIRSAGGPTRHSPFNGTTTDRWPMPKGGAIVASQVDACSCSTGADI